MHVQRMSSQLQGKAVSLGLEEVPYTSRSQITECLKLGAPCEAFTLTEISDVMKVKKDFGAPTRRSICIHLQHSSEESMGRK